jgi:hypothetical protein
VSLAALDPERVRLAVAEFDALGRTKFLDQYGFKKAKSYFLEFDGRLYDSKAVVGRALGLSARQFSGGDETVARRLGQLGFEVRHFPVAVWKREEIILVCAVLERNGWHRPSRADYWQTVELSELLQTDLFHPFDQHSPDFRGQVEVARQMANILTSRPIGPSTDNRLDGQVAHEFETRPAEMHAEAARLRTLILGHDVSDRRNAAGGAVVFDVPVEAHHTVQYETHSRSLSATAVRREAELVTRYRRWSEDKGHHMTGKDILLPGRKAPLRVDLYDLTDSELIEAKASAARDSVRFALGQIFDYSRYVVHEKRAVLLPNRPDADLVDLLSRNGISCIYETRSGTFERINAGLTSS